MTTIIIKKNSITSIADMAKFKGKVVNNINIDEIKEAVKSIISTDNNNIENSIIERGVSEYSNEDMDKIGQSSFRQCYALTSINLPNTTIVEPYAFRGCTALISINLPSVTTVGTEAFRECKKLSEITLPELVSISKGVFYQCEKLIKADFHVATEVNTQAFYRCYNLTTLILRNKTVATLSKTNALTSCYHFYGTKNSTYNPDGLKDGYIYVPRALVSEYQTATNWSTLATQFRALEDYTIDGTITGELDETKVNA